MRAPKWHETTSALQEAMYQRYAQRRRDQSRWGRERRVLLAIINREITHVSRVTSVLKRLEERGLIRITEPLFKREAKASDLRYKVDFITFEPHSRWFKDTAPKRTLEV